MTEASEACWDAFVRTHPQATFFHLSAWRHVARDVFGHDAHYLSVERDGAVAAVLPLVEIRSRLFGHALISNAFCVGGGPLAVDETALADVVARAEALGRQVGADYVELRDTGAAGPQWLQHGDLYAGFEGPIAASEDDNLKQIPRKQRAVIRKALGQGMTTTIDPHPAAFFELYARTMRDHGTPAMPRRYFEKLMALFGEDCEVLTVRQDRVLPYYTGSRLEARGLGANDLMYWALMRRAVERGCTVFDFGRSKVGTGPYSFKRNWGFEPRPITHQYRLLKRKTLPELNPTNPRYAAMIRAWRMLPVPVATAISPMLSRSLG
jgi:FemAB-related protein (PEP-CTERM system-associated)